MWAVGGKASRLRGIRQLDGHPTYSKRQLAVPRDPTAKYDKGP